MKTLTIGDIHGVDTWKSIKDVAHQYDKIIFIGDYVDAQAIPPDQILENLNAILAFKEKYPEKVILLIGNHDIQYMMEEMQCSGYEPEYADVYQELLSPEKLQVAYQIGTYLWTHAGVNSVWEEKYLLSVPKDQYANKLNDMFKEEEGKRQLLEVGPRRGGMNKTGGPIWCDYSEIKAYPVPGLKQIFGHTPVYEIETINGSDYQLVNCNCLPMTVDFYEVEVEMQY